ncbi:MAG: NAD(P)/FAD-dependent oxidoreductase [Candidatus Magasanikiibacteriota bacterium]
MEQYDVIIIGAGFSGLTLAHHLPHDLRVLVLDRKQALNSVMETTGLITQATKDLISEFVDIENYLPNHIDTIGVVSPDYDKYFFSHTTDPWIYSTDTPELVKHLADAVPNNVDIKIGQTLVDYKIDNSSEYPVLVEYANNGTKSLSQTKFLVGADGGNSTVAKLNDKLSKNTKFLIGFEKVFFGDITFGPKPNSTVYHFWFGEFSLGYGGWLSPTVIDNKSAFRLGLAKLEKDKANLKKLDDFINILQEKKIIKIDSENIQPVISFGNKIPIGGVLPNLTADRVMLIGDAGGFCGAFAADGIKGAVLSGKTSAKLITKYLQGDKDCLKSYISEMQKNNKIIYYYRKQLLYRWLWNLMKTNNSFMNLYRLIERQKDDFLNQFCDSKDKRKSLFRVLLKFKNIPLLFRYAFSLLFDLFRPRP